MFKKVSFISLSAVLISLLLVSVAFAVDYQEAPELRELVEKGELPPVEDRLPPEPVVVEPIDEIGQYGGTWRQLADELFMRGLTEQLIYIDHEDDFQYKPNLAESYEVNDDKTKFVFNLRKGVKWSDGEPFTSEDLIFWWEARILNKQVTPVGIPNEYLSSEGEVPEVTAPDEYTIIFEYPDPNPDLLEFLAGPPWQHDLSPTPKHYLKKFHKDYADEDKLQQRVEESGLDSWYQLFDSKLGITQDAPLNPDLPTLYPWVVETDPQSNLRIAKRNPYYWKVDPEGKQLPYIDSIKWVNIEDTEVKLMKGMQGEVDFSLVSQSTDDFPMLIQNEEEGNYKAVKKVQSFLNGAGVTLNFNYNYYDQAESEKEKKIGELLRNKKFRRAMNFATDREEINEFVAMGMGEIRQGTLNNNHPVMTRERSKKYTEYRPDKARELLDEIGLKDEDGDGFREFPDGEKLEVIISPPAFKTQRTDAALIMKPQWEKVGIRTLIRPEEKSLWVEKRATGQHQINIYATSASAGILSGYFFPVTDWCHFAPLYGSYYITDGEGGVEPEGKFEKLMDLYRKIKAEKDEEKRLEYEDEVVEMHLENLWQVGIIGYPPWPMVLHERMRNVNVTEDGDVNNYGTTSTSYDFNEQFWIDQSVEK